MSSVVRAAGGMQGQLTLNVNTPSNGDQFLGPTFILDDGYGNSVTYFNYAHYITPGTFVITDPLGSVLDPSDVTGFNIELDPAGYGMTAPYDITFNSLALVTPVPEPTTLALLALGAG